MNDVLFNMLWFGNNGVGTGQRETVLLLGIWFHIESVPEKGQRGERNKNGG